MTELSSVEPIGEYWQQLAAHAPAENELRDALIKFRETLKADSISHHRVAIGILERQMSDVLAKLNAADAEFLHLREMLGPDDVRIKELRSHRFHLSVESLRLRASIRKLENFHEDADSWQGGREGWDDDFKISNPPTADGTRSYPH